MAYLKLDLHSDQARACDFRNYTIRNCLGSARVSPQSDPGFVDYYELAGGIRIIINAINSVQLSEGFIFGNRGASRRLVEKLNIGDLVVR